MGQRERLVGPVAQVHAVVEALPGVDLPAVPADELVDQGSQIGLAHLVFGHGECRAPGEKPFPEGDGGLQAGVQLLRGLEQFRGVGSAGEKGENQVEGRFLAPGERRPQNQPAVPRLGAAVPRRAHAAHKSVVAKEEHAPLGRGTELERPFGLALETGDALHRRPGRARESHPDQREEILSRRPVESGVAVQDRTGERLDGDPHCIVHDEFALHDGQPPLEQRRLDAGAKRRQGGADEGFQNHAVPQDEFAPRRDARARGMILQPHDREGVDEVLEGLVDVDGIDVGRKRNRRRSGGGRRPRRKREDAGTEGNEEPRVEFHYVPPHEGGLEAGLRGRERPAL